MKKLLIALLVVLCLCTLVLPACASAAPANLIDDADLLNPAEEAILGNRLIQISDKYDLDLVILTVESLNGKSDMVFADDYLDYHDYREDAALLLCCPEEDVLYISTQGSAISYFEDRLSDLSSAIRPEWNRANYYDAFSDYVTACDTVLEEETAFPWGMIPLALAIGVVLSFLIPMSTLKGQLKSVRSKAEASDYVRQGSMQLTENRDIFLYHTVTKTAKPKNNSSTHTSSSGRSHGGGRL